MSRFLTMTRLIELARFGPGQVLPTESYQAHPVPVRHRDGLQVAFLYGRSRSRPETGRDLFPPRYIAYMSASSGQLELMREVDPGEVGPRADPDTPLGKHSIGMGMSVGEFDARQRRVYLAFDFLLPAFADRRPAVG